MVKTIDEVIEILLEAKAWNNENGLIPVYVEDGDGLLKNFESIDIEEGFVVMVPEGYAIHEGRPSNA